MLIIGPDIPAEMRPFALSVVEAIRALQTPRSPTPVFSCAQAELPPAPLWADCVLRVSNLDVLAMSNGVAWIRQDTATEI